MVKHKKIYFDAFGYTMADFIPSEISGIRADDIHHIEARGMGGSENLDRIENLMAVTRSEHNEFGDISKYKSELFRAHREFMERRGVDFDAQWISNKIKLYTNG